MRFPVPLSLVPSFPRPTVLPLPCETLRAHCPRLRGAVATSVTSPVALLLLVLSGAVACGEERSARADEERTGLPPAWVTEAEYRFGDLPEEEVFFASPEVRADPARGRIFAVDPRNHQVSAWTPDGTLLFRVGQEGEGPGEFIDMGSLHIEEDGAFRVQEAGRGRYTRYTAHGELVGTTPGPPATVSYQGRSVDLHWPDEGFYLGSLPITTSSTPTGETLFPDPRRPVLSVRDLGNGQWSDPEPLLWLEIGNLTHVIEIPDGILNHEIVTAQPFGDPDHVRFEPGAAVVMRPRGDPGTVELIEVDASGDTVWHRRLELTPRRLTSELVDEVAEAWLAQRASGDIPPAQLRRSYFDGLYQPEYVPPAEAPPVLTASGEVWVRTPEVLDTLRVYYAVPRGEPAGSPRRVLLPESLWLTDATETHVWGAQWDPVGRPHVIGRRLVPPAE